MIFSLDKSHSCIHSSIRIQGKMYHANIFVDAQKISKYPSPTFPKTSILPYTKQQNVFSPKMSRIFVPFFHKSTFSFSLRSSIIATRIISNRALALTGMILHHIH